MADLKLLEDAEKAMHEQLPAPAVPDLKHCACEFDGDTCVTQCKLHAAHVDAIHEWAERAKSAEARIAAPAVREPLTDQKRGNLIIEHLSPQIDGEKMSIYDAFLLGIDAGERAHGIIGDSK